MEKWFEEIIPVIIFFIIWIVSALIKKAPKDDQANFKKKKQGLLEVLKSTLESAGSAVEKKYAELETPQERMRERVFRPGYYEPYVPATPADLPEIDLDEVKEGAVEKTELLLEEDVAAPVDEVRPLKATVIEPGRQKLREAVVWSEILAPPVALREDKRF